MGCCRFLDCLQKSRLSISEASDPLPALLSIFPLHDTIDPRQ